MNKIYKVIWSKVRNCYVAVSEIAKRNGKSCTSVNCGAKANRRCVGMVLAIALSLSMTGGGVAWGEDITIDGNTPEGQRTISDDQHNNNFLIRANNITFTVTGSDGKVGYIDAYGYSGNTIEIKNGAAVTGVLTNQGFNMWGINGGTINNNVNIAGNVNYNIYGGRINSSGVGTSVTGNQVTINSGTIGGNVYGGFALNPTVTEISNNRITIKGGTLNDIVYGGAAASGQTVSGNYVTVEGGTLNSEVVGGSSKTVTGTYVSISGGTVNGKVYGGRHYNESTTSSATDNHVTISGTAVVNDAVYGGYVKNGTANNNSVTITGGDFTSSLGSFSIYGGNGSGNVVTLAGGTFKNNLVFNINAGSGGSNNTLNLYGEVSGLNKASLYGGAYDGTGNELHIGGTKSGTAAEGTTLAPWSGTEGNKVSGVFNFSSIVLHKVNWSTSTPVLAAKTFTRTSILDISDISLQGTLSLGSMALLQLQSNSVTSYINNMTLTYKDADDAPQTEQTIGEDGIKLKSISDFGTDTSITGVSVAYDGARKVTRDSDDTSTSINYTIYPEYKSATLGAMSWTSGGYTFADDATISNGGLTVGFADNDGFKVDGAADQANGETMDLLTLPDASDGVKSAVSKEVMVTLADAAVTDKLTFSRTRTDTASASAGDKKVVYTTGSYDKVTTATFNGEIAWSTTPYYTHATDSPYQFDSSTAINAAGLTISTTSLTDSQKAALKKDSNMTLISASGITESNNSNITQPTSNTVAISMSDKYSNTFTATAVGTVAAEADAVKYKISSIDVNTVTLGWGNNYSTPARLPDTWTASNGTTIDASQFTLEYSTAWPVSLPIGTEIPVLTGTGLGNSPVSHQPGANKGKLPVNYTNYDTGIRFLATATGTIAPAEDKLNYVVGAVEVSKVYLAGWKGTAASPTSSVPTGWTAQDGGVDVYTNNMTNLPTNLAPGGSVDILTGSAGFFTDTRIQGANKYGNGDAFNEKPTGETGIAIAGNKVGGVKAENIGENVGAKLTYYAEKKSVSTITLGTETFTNGGTVYGGAESEFTNMYDATGATINTDALAFSNSSVMEAGDSMTILNARNSTRQRIFSSSIQTSRIL